MEAAVPGALPAIFTGLRISAGLSVIGAIVGDFFFRRGDKPGLGVLIENYRQKGIYPADVRRPDPRRRPSASSSSWVFGWLGNAVVGHWYDRRSR